MRVLHVLQPPDGGVPEQVLRLAEGAIQAGHAVTVAAPAATAVRPAFEEAGAVFSPLELEGRVPAPVSDLAARRAIARLLAPGAFDVVHAHGQKAGLLARPAAHRAGIPAVYTPHGLIYRTQAQRPRRGGRVRAQIALRLERALGRRTAAIVCVAGQERLAAVADGLAPPERIHTVRNGVAPDTGAAPDRRLVEFAAGRPLFGFLAGLREQKGLPTLLDALEQLAARGTAPAFAIAGNGPLAGEIRDRIASGPLAPSTLILGFEGRVEPYLAAFDAFVLPSYWEGLSLALLEAMAMGLPVVASAVGGTPEAVADRETGLLVAPRNAAALAAAIEELAADAALRERLGARGRAVAADRFTVERMVEETLAIYEGVTREAARRPAARGRAA